ncbi:MAG: bifunctional hydroxymethylpyrimidine kinase/phosphomethylpyrimidine kinase [Leptospiraceae bacterium]|nr:bifunctional hydroxymethylpyrimidine kinase/phosphomethylpyrimidine kinase [Leptospiraceae bacterium]
MEKMKAPIAMTIAGSDSGGGAGIQADLKTFAFHNVFGTSSITCLTAQNPEEVTSILEVPIEVLEAQILTVLRFFPVNSMKTGMLFADKIIKLVAMILEKKPIPTVIDPVMVASSGAVLLKTEAIDSLKTELIPKAALVTPNIDEAKILIEENIQFDTMDETVKNLYKKYKVPFLLKGGHIPSNGIVRDVFFDGTNFLILEKPFIENVGTHGTGCTYSAAITANLALGKTLVDSVFASKEYLHACLVESRFTGDYKSLNHNPRGI